MHLLNLTTYASGHLQQIVEQLHVQHELNDVVCSELAKQMRCALRIPSCVACRSMSSAMLEFDSVSMSFVAVAASAHTIHRLV